MRSVEIEFNLHFVFFVLLLAMMMTTETFDDHVRGVAEFAVESMEKDSNEVKINSKFLTDDNPLSNFLIFLIKVELLDKSVHRDFILFSVLSAKDNIISVGFLGYVFVLLDKEEVKSLRKKKKLL
jgi:hypothetical protein